MIAKDAAARYRAEAAKRSVDAGIYVTPAEVEAIETADFGLDRFEEIGLGVLVYVNTDRCCAKELAMWPGQTCPEHRHPPVGSDPGKEETFRCRAGTVYLYVEGTAAERAACAPPAGTEDTYSVWHEVALGPGEQYTIFPNTKHWFQAGPEGCVVSEFSTRSTDENDIFTDAEIQRITQIR
ncbi:MAG: D-lyxose/D-mannose family sugar isomerase [Armatimonadota bacterium]